MNSKNMSELIDMMKTVATNYFKARRTIIQNPDNLTDNNFHLLCAYIYAVVSSYSRLSSYEKLFLNNEFFYGAHDGWWKSSLSYSDYLVVCKKSITDFLVNFHEAI